MFPGVTSQVCTGALVWPCWWSLGEWWVTGPLVWAGVGVLGAIPVMQLIVAHTGGDELNIYSTSLVLGTRVPWYCILLHECLAMVLQ